MDLRHAVREWGSTAEERAEPWACDEWLADPDLTLFRAADADASAATMFRWLCQLRVGPYSYDLIDNLGRRSPRELIPGIDRLAVGQRFATIFELVAFVAGEQITIRATNHLFGDVVITYRVRPVGERSSRVCVKVLVHHRRDPLGLLWRLTLAEGDLVMMRKQLRTLTSLAARTGSTNEDLAGS